MKLRPEPEPEITIRGSGGGKRKGSGREAEGTLCQRYGSHQSRLGQARVLAAVAAVINRETIRARAEQQGW